MIESLPEYPRMMTAYFGFIRPILVQADLSNLAKMNSHLIQALLAGLHTVTAFWPDYRSPLEDLEMLRLIGSFVTGINW